MSHPPRYYGENDLHYLTTSVYRRTQIFNSERFKSQFVATLAELRAELRFRLLGYVLMPEHFHLLLWPSEAANPSQVMQRLKGRTARFILKTLRQERQHAWCRQNVEAIYPAGHRPRRGELSRVAAQVLRYEHLE